MGTDDYRRLPTTTDAYRLRQPTLSVSVSLSSPSISLYPSVSLCLRPLLSFLRLGSVSLASLLFFSVSLTLRCTVSVATRRPPPLCITSSQCVFVGPLHLSDIVVVSISSR